MALRYEYPGSVCAPKSADLLSLPAMREPANVFYNGEADIEDFLVQLDGKPYCKVEGPTGVGKTSVLPKLIAMRTHRLVLVVTAHPLLAHSGYDYFRNHKLHGVDGSGLRACHMVDNDLDIDDYDIIWVSAARLVSWMIAHKDKGDVTHILADAVVFLDEAHEADAYTHVVRTVIPQCGASTLLLVSATFDPKGHDVSSNRNVQVKTYDKADEPKTWDVTKVGKPWSYNMIRDAAILFIDKDFDAERLAKQYRTVGYLAFRLTARSTITEYTRAIGKLNDPKAPPVVLLLDSSYRSGFNFDVDIIIDTGVRYIPSGDTGTFSYIKRYIYNVEFVQSAGRGGRFGRSTIYYMPNVEPEWKICDLEPVEREAAALLTRCFGFFPNRETAATVMAYDDLPIGVDVVAALNGPTPLSCYVRDKSGTRKSEAREVKTPVSVPRAVSNVSKASRQVTPARKSVTSETVVSNKTASTKLTSGTLIRANSEYGLPASLIKGGGPLVDGSTNRSVSATQRSSAQARGSGVGRPRDELRRSVLQKRRQSSVSDNGSTSSANTRLTVTSLRMLEAEYASRVDTNAVALSGRPPTDIAAVSSKLVSGLGPTEIDYLDRRSVSIVPRDSVSHLDACTHLTDTKDNLTVRFDGLPKPILRKEPSDKALTTATDVVHKSIDEIWQQMLNADSSRDTVPVRCGTYLHSPDIIASQVVPYSRYFPKGERSVLELLNEGELLRVASSLGREHLKFALYHALRRYNTTNMQVNAVKRAVAEIMTSHYSKPGFMQAKRLFENVVQTVAMLEIERDSYFSAILGLAADNFVIEHIEGVYSHEIKATAKYLKLFRGKMESERPPAKFVSADWIDKVDLLEASIESGAIVPYTRKAVKARTDEKVKVVYVKPSIGISTATVNMDETVDIKPTRMMRYLTGVDKISISGVDFRQKPQHKRR